MPYRDPPSSETLQSRLARSRANRKADRRFAIWKGLADALTPIALACLVLMWIDWARPECPYCHERWELSRLLLPLPPSLISLVVVLQARRACPVWRRRPRFSLWATVLVLLVCLALALFGHRFD